MKKFLLLTLFLALAGGVFAANRVPRPQQKAPQADRTLPVASSLKQTMAVENPEEVSDWVSIGKGRFVDGIVTQVPYYMSLSDYTAEVDVEESESNPGLYRVANPYRALYEVGGLESYDVFDGDYYMIIDATDPERVVMPEWKTGFAYYDYDANLEEDLYAKSWDGCYGKLEDMVVTFNAWELVFRTETLVTSWTVCNYQSTFRLYIPGAVDYSFMSTQGDVCPIDNIGSYTLTIGADIASVKALVVNDIVNDDDAYGRVAAEGTELDKSAGTYSVELNTEGYYNVFIIAYDEEGNEKGRAKETFYRFDDNNDQWESLGNTTMNEAFVAAFWGDESSSYTVEIQKHVTADGIYRIVNPYVAGEGTVNHTYSTVHEGHNHYIYINASDPDRVYVYESPIGANDYYGDDVITSYAYDYMKRYGDTADEIAAENLFGKVENGVIIMPEGTMAVWMQQYNNGYRSTAGEFSVVIPQEHTVTVVSAAPEAGSVSIISPAAEGTTLSTKEARVTIKATAAEGASFMYWSDAEGNRVATTEEYTYEGSTDAEFTAHFGYAFTFSTDGNGTIRATDKDGYSVFNNTILEKGAVVTLSFIPNNEYELTGVTVNGEAGVLTEDGELTIEKATNVVATFERKKYMLTIDVTGNGTVSLWTDDGELTSGMMIPTGTEIYFRFDPSEGAELSDVLITGVDGYGTVTMDDLPDFEDGDGVYFMISDGALTFEVMFAGGATAIDAIEADDQNAPAVYYNLQGIRVDATQLTTGFYIRRQGSKTTKVFVKK